MRLKALHKKNLIKAKKIIVDSIMDQIIPQVSSLNTPKMFDSLIELFEDNNIIQKMDLRKQLKNVKIQNGIHSCEECVPKESDYFQLTLGRRRSASHKKRRRKMEAN